MNPDKEDPNNHVPAVSPDDDWDGLDVSQVFDSQLPPRRSDAAGVLKAEVSLTGFKSIEPSRATATSASSGESSLSNSSVNMNVNTERSIQEKDNFQAARVMDETKPSDKSELNHHPSGMRSRLASGERDDWGRNHQKGSSRWMIFAAIGVILLISLTVFVSQFTGKKAIRKPDQADLGQLAPVEVEKEQDEDLGLLGKLANSNKEALQMFGNYAQAQSPDDFLKYIYLSELNASLVLDQWRSLGAKSGWRPSDTSAWKSRKDGELLYAELRGVNHDFSKFLAFFRFENTDLKMDWKATTGYSTAGFDELKMGEGDGSEIRGWISRADFFTQKLPESGYHSFLVTSPKQDASIWAYTEIGSEADKNILALFTVSPITGEYQSQARVTLNLERGTGEILPSQWMIKGLIAESWLDQATP